MKKLLLAAFSSVLGLSSVLAVDPPFAGGSGDYGGTIEDSTGLAPDNSGIVTVALRESGAFSATLVWQQQQYKLKGLVNPTTAQYTVDLPKKLPTTLGTKLTVSLTVTVNTLTIDGTLTDPDGGTPVTASFQLSGQPPDPAIQLDPGQRMAFIDPTAVAAAPEAGAANVPPAPTVSEDGYALVTIANVARRSSRFVGRLPDSQGYMTGSPLRGSQYALRSGLYPQPKTGAGGQLLGRGDISSAIPKEGSSPQAIGTQAALIAALNWHKKPGLKVNTSYPSAFQQRVNLDTIQYTRDRDMSRVLTGVARSTANATMRLTRGNLAAPDHDPIKVDMNVSIFGIKIIGANPYKVSIKVSPLAGTFTGSFQHPDSGEKKRVGFKGSFRSFFGVVPGEGRGNFLSTPSRDDPSQNKAGSVRITIN